MTRYVEARIDDGTIATTYICWTPALGYVSYHTGANLRIRIAAVYAAKKKPGLRLRF